MTVFSRQTCLLGGTGEQTIHVLSTQEKRDPEHIFKHYCISAVFTKKMVYIPTRLATFLSKKENIPGRKCHCLSSHSYKIKVQLSRI